MYAFREKGAYFLGRVSILKLINVSCPTSMIVKCPTFGTDKYYNINKLSVFCPIFRDMGQWDTWDNLGHLGHLGQLGQLGKMLIPSAYFNLPAIVDRNKKSPTISRRPGI